MKQITRYLAIEKATPRSLETIVELAARAMFDSAGYEVLHKTIAGAAAYPAMHGKNPDKLYFVKVEFTELPQ